MEEVDQEQTGSTQETNTEKLNDYAKVILAAKLSRRINDLRFAAREQLSPEELGKMDRRKVTTVALEELDKGAVKISRQSEEPTEETYDLT